MVSETVSASDPWTPFSCTPMATQAFSTWGFPAADAQPTYSEPVIRSKLEPTTVDEHGFCNDDDLLSCVRASFDGSPADLCCLPATVTASNAQMQRRDSVTSSLLGIHFDGNHPLSGSNAKISLDRNLCYAVPSNLTLSTNDIKPPSSKRPYDSLQSNIGSRSAVGLRAQMRRRRRSEHVEPVSARAVYLEKNREAASKCRSKQKRQQAELVETARDVERRNVALKAEVEMLRSALLDLVEFMCKHVDCGDARLRAYIQRRADQLATGHSLGTLPL